MYILSRLIIKDWVKYRMCQGLSIREAWTEAHKMFIQSKIIDDKNLAMIPLINYSYVLKESYKYMENKI